MFKDKNVEKQCRPVKLKETKTTWHIQKQTHITVRVLRFFVRNKFRKTNYQKKT